MEGSIVNSQILNKKGLVKTNAKTVYGSTVRYIFNILSTKVTYVCNVHTFSI